MGSLRAEERSEPFNSTPASTAGRRRRPARPLLLMVLVRPPQNLTGQTGPSVICSSAVSGFDLYVNLNDSIFYNFVCDRTAS